MKNKLSNQIFNNQRLLKKVCTEGTHRACDLEETWKKISKLLPEFGITRLADITWLDRFGIPVYAAIRPNSRTIAQSNGKGVTKLHAKVSAAMESIEVFHAEEIKNEITRESVHSLEKQGLLTYNPFSLSLNPDSFLSPHFVINWLKCEDISLNKETYIPLEPICLDWRVSRDEFFPCFMSDTIGLASGNNFLEATLHALCEIIERDAILKYEQMNKQSYRLVDLSTIDSKICLEMLEIIEKNGARIYIEDITSDIYIPAFKATVVMDDNYSIYTGFGCHPDKEVALLRAVTEVMQVRATYISAARDDIHEDMYSVNSRELEKTLIQQIKVNVNLLDYRQLLTMSCSYIEEDLEVVIYNIRKKLNTSILVVDLTNPSYDINVVKVIVPFLYYKIHKLGDFFSSRPSIKSI